MTRHRKSELRELLNKIWWTDRREECYIVIIHRGAPNDRKIIPLTVVSEIKAGYIFIDDVQIPIHRITEIVCNDIIIWKRKNIS